MIPKIIMQTSKEKPPEYVVNKIKKFCPDWEYSHFVDTEIIEFFKNNPLKEFPNIIEKFNSFTHGAHKSDIFRYYYLYLKGGIFLDSDAIFEKNIDYILENYDTVLVKSFSRMPHIFTGFIATYPKSELLYQALVHAYNTVYSKITHYHYFVEEFWRIYQRLNLPNLKLYQEINRYKQGYGGSWIIKIDEEKQWQIILSHYWKSKKIPK